MKIEKEDIVNLSKVLKDFNILISKYDGSRNDAFAIDVSNYVNSNICYAIENEKFSRSLLGTWRLDVLVSRGEFLMEHDGDLMFCLNTFFDTAFKYGELR